MAIPTMTANSPVAGSIAWAAFTIQYGGVGTAISAGSTSERWVWWRWNGGGANSIVEAGPDLPSDLTDDDLVLFGNKNGIPFRVQSSSFVDGELIVDGSILTQALAAESVTADKVSSDIITANEIYSQEAYFGGISATQIMSGTVEADLLLAGSIKTANTGARVENGPGGIVVFNTGGDPVIVLPSNISETNPATFKGEGRFSGLTAESLTVQGTENEIAAGGVLELSAGITAPKTSPTMAGEYYYDQVPVPPGLEGYSVKGAQFSNSKWIILWGSADQRNAQWHEYTVNGDGTLAYSGQVQSHSGGSQAYITIRGAAKVGTTTPIWWNLRYVGTSTPYYEAAAVTQGPVGVTLSQGSFENSVAIGTDGTDVYLAYVRNASGTLRYRIGQYNAVTGALIANHDLTGGPVADKGLYALYVGNGDFGSKKFVLTQEEQSRSLVFDFATKAYESTKTWLLGGSIWGTVYDGASFWTVSAGGLRLRYEGGNADVTAPDSPEYWHVAYTFYDGAGTPHETTLSPTKTISAERRARYKFTSEDIPVGGSEDPNSIRWYVAKTTTNAPPARTSYKLVATTTVPSLIISDLVLGTTTPPDPASNPTAFPSSGFGRLKSPGSSPDIDLRGDGTWFLRGLNDTSWTSFTPVWSGATTPYTVGNGSLVGAYKKIGSLVFVRIRGVVGSTSVLGTGQMRLTLPFPASSNSVFHLPATIFDASASSTWRATLAENTNVAGKQTGAVLIDSATAGGALRSISNSVPFTWAAGDIVDVMGFYEAA